MTESIPQNIQEIKNKTPLGFYVMIEILTSEEEELKSTGGIIIPSSSKNMIDLRGELGRIVSIGEDAFLNCFGQKQNIPPIGSCVFMQQNAGFVLPNAQGKIQYRFVDSSAIICLIPENEISELIKYQIK